MTFCVIFYPLRLKSETRPEPEFVQCLSVFGLLLLIAPVMSGSCFCKTGNVSDFYVSVSVSVYLSILNEVDILAFI